MKPTNEHRIKRATVGRYAILAAIVWTVLIVAVLLWNMHYYKIQMLEIAKDQARTSFEKDLVYRRWAAMHGGMYVPVTKDTPPNPYLSHVEERDISTPSGRQLTLMDPAYMTRQVHELGARQYGFRGHITSLKPIRPENAPDPWERSVLEGFEANPIEATSLEEVDGQAYMRLMRPVVTEQRCLKCHASQGYRVGEIRGGISVSVPMEPLWTLMAGELEKIIFGYVVIWLLGLVGIGMTALKIKGRIDQYNRIEKEREQLLHDMDERIKELRCMYGVVDSIRSRDSLEEIFMDVVALIPLGWQYPETTRGKICFEGREYQLEPFGESKWKQSADIVITGEKRGVVEAYYLKECPDTDEGPFLKEERELIDEIAQALSEAIQRKWIMEALCVSEARLKEAQRIGAMGYWEFDVDTEQIIWSEELYELFEREPADGPPSYEEHLAYYIPEDARKIQERVRRAIEQAEEFDDDYRLKLPGGRCTYQRFIIKVDKDTEKRVVKLYGIAQDVTERKEAEKELKETHQRLIEAAHKAGMWEVATNILHNIGNVLNSINVSASSIRETVLKSKAGNLKKVVDLISEHTQELGTFLTEDEQGRHIPVYLTEVAAHMVSEQEHMIEKIRSLTKHIEHVKQIVQSQQKNARLGGVEVFTSINEIIEDAIEINQEGLMRHDVNVRLELAELPTIHIDKQRVLQILVNLISNAKYATSKSEKQEKLIIIRSYIYDENRLRIDVVDNGIGISKENRSKIFQHGFTTKEKGHGFGLHSSALAAQEMGGSLAVYSEGLGHGSTFTLELSLNRSEAVTNGCSNE